MNLYQKKMESAMFDTKTLVPPIGEKYVQCWPET